MLYGREPERSQIQRLADALVAGHGDVLVVRGPAGMGKTALVNDVIGSTDRLRVCVVRGVAAESALPFGGVHQLVDQLPTDIDGLPVEQAGALRVALGAAGHTTDLAVCAATVTLLRHAARRRPLLLVVDDVHELDRASRLVLLFVARRVMPECPVGMLLTVRADEAELTADLPQLALRELSPAAARALLDAVGRTVDAVTVATLARVTGGNPLALLELSRRGRLEQTMLDALADGTVRLDDALRRLFAGRLDTLPTAARQALLVAAADDSADPAVVRHACHRLGLADPGDLPSELVTVADRVEFGHPLIRSAVYSAASTRQRARVHTTIAEVVSDPARARWHRARAATGPDESLAAALDGDATDAERRGGMGAAVAVLHRASRLSGSPESRAHRTAMAAHAAWKSGTPTLARALLDDARRISSDPATEQSTVRVRALVELFSGDQDVAADFLLRQAADHGQDTGPELLFMAAGAALSAGRIDDAVRAAERIGRIDAAHRPLGRWLSTAFADSPAGVTVPPGQVLAELPEAIQRSGAHRWLYPMAIATRTSDRRKAREFGLAAVDDLRTTGMLAITTLPLVWLADIEFGLGRWADARATAADGLHAATDAGQPPRIADCHSLLALIAAATGDARGCREHAHSALSLARATGNRLAAARATWAVSGLELARGEYNAAAARLASLSKPGMPHAHPHIARLAVADTTEAHMRIGDVEAATATVDELRHWITANADPVTYGRLHLCEGLLLADATAADKAYQLAASLLDPATAPFEHARTAFTHGQWLRRERRTREARERIRRAAELFAELGGQTWADRATAELRACGGRYTATPEDTAAISATLTAQERQVVELAAAGLTNREIGTRLFISPRTVGYHLHKVFGKLGVSRRSQLRTLIAANGEA